MTKEEIEEKNQNTDKKGGGVRGRGRRMRIKGEEKEVRNEDAINNPRNTNLLPLP